MRGFEYYHSYGNRGSVGRLFGLWWCRWVGGMEEWGGVMSV